ncbi:hypothetical protein HJFPF1_02536 [Paramyrothecium foliicola]|nr:hypothetical protein HJFPF1_02536 [Paramyrothecium foliicola]
MDSFLPLGGFQLPFQRSLSRLYNDTKKSSDFVKEPVRNEEDPDIKALHRKLRIQKDRLVSWGLEWSDPTQAVEIDESLSKAGLSEVVGSIMSNIKDILAEAEPLWLSSKQIVEASRPSPDRKAPLVQWDKGRFEDLVRDLTSCIDTLYDLSRTRTSAVMARRPTKTPIKASQSSSDDFKPFESSRMQTPQQIDPGTLTHLRPMQSDPQNPPLREVVFMSKTAYSELTHGTTRQPWAPLLLEYATFDAIYAMTGIMPPMARFEKLSAGLQQDPQRSPGTWTGLPRLLGYFEDMENSRLGLVYRFPPSFNAVSFEKLNQNPSYNLPTLGDMLARPDSEPQLEAKFRLAHNLANTIFDMHARGITHGNLLDRNVTFCDAITSSPGVGIGEVDIRRPLVSSFDVFSDETSSTGISLTRHPLDPRITPTSPLANTTDERILELYSLAMVLLSIGLWTRLEDLVPDPSSTAVSQALLNQLAVRCGSLYAKAVQSCWDAVDDELAGRASGEALLSAVQLRAGRFLEACCILDGVSGLEERLSHELNESEATAKPEPLKQKPGIKSAPSLVTDNKQSPAAHDRAAAKVTEKADAIDTDTEGKWCAFILQVDYQLMRNLEYFGKVNPKPEAKLRLYPHVALAPDVVEKWNTILMPQINHALRQFYRKHPESVEISLESVGPNPNRTTPTVLVVCTSVGKVRAILKKRLGELFDGSTGFSLKVCRGHVLRSHRQSKPIMRSMARRSQAGGDGAESDDEGIEPVNPEYQERPGNGASIGAWIGDRHLPPVSFGGLVIVDDKPYGMTVHHMLDDPDRDFGRDETTRSSGIPSHEWYAESLASTADDDYSYELSDGESEPYSDTDITSDDEDDEYDDDDEYNEPGDIPGVEPGCGEGYVVTQPALDDVEDGFYPCTETAGEDHLDTFSLGEVYASSGIRRKNTNGLVHEVDWALFQFDEERLPQDNFIPRVEDATTPLHSAQKHEGQALLRPTTIAPTSALPGMEVQCVARTSGLQTGQILPALTSVKIYGRASPSHTYQIASVPPSKKDADSKGPLPMGIPGDSGAWVVDRQHGHLCGHVLAWSQRKHVAYICPMDVLLLDIAQTLDANEIRLPGGEPVVTSNDLGTSRVSQGKSHQTTEELSEDEGYDGYEDDSPPQLAQEVTHSTNSFCDKHSNPRHQSLAEGPISASSCMGRSGEMPCLTSKLEDISIGGGGMGAKWLTCAARP